MERESAADRRLVEDIGAHARVADRLRDVTFVHSGSVFLTASADHIATRRRVLLTIARPGDEDAMGQLRIVREMLTEVGDERLGIVIDGIWPDTSADAWGCLVSTWHHGLRALNEALVVTGAQTSANLDVLGVLRSLTRQLKKIHDAGFAHGDLSIPNVQATAETTVHIVDFEHVVGAGNLGRTKIAGTPGYTHPNKSTVNATHVSLEQHQTWDRYALGQIFLSVLATLSPHTVTQLTPKNQRAIRLMGAMLLDGKNTESELALGLPCSFFNAEQFRSLDDVVDAIDRLSGRVRLEDEVPELISDRTSVVEIGLRRPAAFTARTSRLLATRPMRYLDQFHQLGLINFIWPSATHKRAEHAIGTYGLAAALVIGVLNDSESPAAQILLTKKYVKLVLLAALLHDVGHYPLAHDMEEAHRSLFKHEDRSVQKILSPELAEIIADGESLGGWEVLPADVASVVEGKPLEGSSLGSDMCALLHTFISGPVDADKLDYLRRDSRYLNVAAGNGLDIDRLISSLTIATFPDSQDGCMRLAVRAKGRRSAELVGRIRSHMFGVVYWHHTYRSIKAMIQWMVWDALSQEDRQSYPREFVTDFYKEVDSMMSVVGAPSTADSPTLFPVPDTTGLVRGALPHAEARILYWIAARGGPESSVIFDHLGAQRWHRSVLTIEHYSNDASMFLDEPFKREEIWTLLNAIYKLNVDKYWKARRLLATTFQEKLCAWLDPQPEGNAGTIVYDFTDTKRRLLSSCVTEQIFLIDGPDPSRAMQKNLFFSLGERRGLFSVNAAEAIAVARSYDEMQLTTEFVATNGAIRVLCDPRYDRFVQTAVSEGTLAAILEQALDHTARSI